MALEITPFYRNLRTRVRALYIEVHPLRRAACAARSLSAIR